MEWLLELLENQTFVWGAMAVLIFAFTQVFKLPIKHFTKNIPSERGKKIANISILVLAFGFAVLLDFLFAYFYLKSDLDLLRALSNWSGSSLVYSIVERFLKKKVENPLDTEEGKATAELIKNVVADGKVTAKDKTAMQEFIDKVK